MAVRAIRGAVQVDANERGAILEGATELVTEVMARNNLVTDDVISVLFTATPDLDAEFPAPTSRAAAGGVANGVLRHVRTSSVYPHDPRQCMATDR